MAWMYASCTSSGYACLAHGRQHSSIGSSTKILIRYAKSTAIQSSILRSKIQLMVSAGKLCSLGNPLGFVMRDGALRDSRGRCPLQSILAPLFAQSVDTKLLLHVSRNNAKTKKKKSIDSWSKFSRLFLDSDVKQYSLQKSDKNALLSIKKFSNSDMKEDISNP